MQMTEFEKIFFDRIKTEQLQVSLLNIREVMKSIWSDDAPRIVKDYTDHGVNHCFRIIQKLNGIFSIQGNTFLAEDELYLLLAGVYLHDIGMQCDVIKFPHIKRIAEEKFGANFESEFTAKTASSYSREEQEQIRKNHQYLTAAWIDYAYLHDETVLAKGVKTIANNLIKDLIDICLFHSKLPITDCPEKFHLNTNGRKQLVASLLRLADELDIDKNRITFDSVETFRYDESNSAFWWLHDHIHIDFQKNEIILRIDLHPEDEKQYGEFIEKKFIKEFNSKNKSVINILVKNNIPILISENSGVVKNEYALKLPQNIINVLLQVKEKKMSLC